MHLFNYSSTGKENKIKRLNLSLRKKWMFCIHLRGLTVIKHGLSHHVLRKMLVPGQEYDGCLPVVPLVDMVGFPSCFISIFGLSDTHWRVKQKCYFS